MTGTLRPAARVFCEHFGIDVPIINAAMAHIAGGALASAVASAGALGLIGVGLITWRLAEQPDLVSRLISDGVRIVFLSFDDPSPYVGDQRYSRSVIRFQRAQGHR